jgi:hypothetical protein
MLICPRVWHSKMRRSAVSKGWLMWFEYKWKRTGRHPVVSAMSALIPPSPPQLDVAFHKPLHYKEREGFDLIVGREGDGQGKGEQKSQNANSTKSYVSLLSFHGPACIVYLWLLGWTSPNTLSAPAWATERLKKKVDMKRDSENHTPKRWPIVAIIPYSHIRHPPHAI